MTQIDLTPLAGGYRRGDCVRALVKHMPINLAVGNEGIVVGPSTDHTASDAADRVCVDFGPGKGKVNIVATSQIELVPLAGGYRLGYWVCTLVAHEPSNILVGDEGIVVGPCTDPTISDAADRVCVDFGPGKGKINIVAMTQIYLILLAGGYRGGDRVRALVTHEPSNLSVGDEGIVVGPSTEHTASDAADRVAVDFGSGKGITNAVATTQIELVPLAGGYRLGDRVRALVNHKPSNLSVGNEGIVVGHSGPTTSDAADRVAVDFGPGKGKISIMAATEIDLIPLAGGYRRGERVRLLVPHEPRSLSVGDEGIVVGPSTDPTPSDAAARVGVDFGPGKGVVKVKAPTQIEPVPLAGGYRRGDRVRALVAHEPSNLAVGDEGLVAGPCTDHTASDTADRVAVDFGSGKGITNAVATTQIELVPLAGGFRRGDRVRSLVNHEPSNLAEGNEGIVVGRSDPTSSDAADRVGVDFGPGKGVVNIVATTEIDIVPLAGGYRRGERVRLRLAHEPRSLAVGDEGIVVGPSTDPTPSDAAARVCVDFGPGKGVVKVKALTYIDLVPLAGGYRRGDRVRALVHYELSNLSVGDEGIVVGPSADPTVSDAANWVCVDFGPGKGVVKVRALTQIEFIPLAGGYRRGDRVRSLVADKPGSSAVGKGIVVGPCTDHTASDASNRVAVDFGSGVGVVNAVAMTQIELVPLAGGYRRGDHVCALVDHKPSNLSVGDEGIVVGRSSNLTSSDAAARVCVDFGPGKGKINIVAMAEIRFIPLAGGYRLGDRVRALVKHKPINLAVGNEGIVVGPSSNPTASDAADRVCVDFGSGKGKVNILALSQINLVPLAGGFRLSDRVRALVAHESSNLAVGDEGIVVGPSTDPSASDAADRVKVDFGPGKGKINVVAMTQIELILLAGGFRRGDRVRALVANEPTMCSDGIEGIVVGPGTEYMASDAAGRVAVDFGSGKGIVNAVAVSQIELVPLAGGYRLGDRVRALVAHVPRNLSLGDEGIVVGPCTDHTVFDAADRVSVDFGPGKGNINILGMTQIDLIPLAGGYRLGDRVRALVPHGPNNVSVGNEGIVVGPSSDPTASDATDRVAVDFGTGKGTVNAVVCSQIELVPLVGGHRRGDRVCALVDEPSNLSVVNEGVEAGACNDPAISGAGDRVGVDFGSGKAVVEMVPMTQIILPKIPNVSSTIRVFEA